jgi:membrane-bound lytic murein transglycosylase A
VDSASLVQHAKTRLTPLSFAELDGFAADDHLAAFRVFAKHASALLDARPPFRPARTASPEFKSICRAARTAPTETADAARLFFEDHFLPFGVLAEEGTGTGFATGY